MNSPEEEYQIKLERQERLEHRDVLLAIGALIKTGEGTTLFRYLFKSLDVLELPPQETDDKILHEHLGFLRAGNSIYKLACQADSEVTAKILSKLERERYDNTYRQYQIENGIDIE